MKKVLSVLLAVLLLCFAFCLTACSPDTRQTIRISTTTSVNDSGLMDFLKPYFESDNLNFKIEVSSAGTGAAINAAKFGNADLILVHSKSQEDAFVSGGFSRIVEGKAAERLAFMYNYFVIVGPTADAAGVATASDVSSAFASIASTKSKFISRGDKSGTHTKEVSLWSTELGITSDTNTLPSSISDWYVSAGQGMGACLTMANENSAYILTDKATYLSYKNADTDKLPNLTLLKEQSESLKNTYSLLAVSKDAPFVNSTTNEPLSPNSVDINEIGADTFIKWMLSERASLLIASYGEANYGAPLFYLMA